MQGISVDMEFYFPPKEKSVALLQAEEKLAAKGYAFSKEKRMCRYDQDNQRLDENKGFVFEAKKGRNFLIDGRRSLIWELLLGD